MLSVRLATQVGTRIKFTGTDQAQLYAARGYYRPSRPRTVHARAGHRLGNKSPKAQPHHSLGSVHMEGSFKGYQESVPLSFPAICSDCLKEFVCSDIACYSNKNVTNALVKLGIAFKTLYAGELPEGRNSSDSDIAQIILSNLQLTSIDIDWCCEARSLTGAAINNAVMARKDLILARTAAVSRNPTLRRRTKMTKTMIKTFAGKTERPNYNNQD